MRRLVSADLKRFFRRPSFYVLIVFLFLEILFITEGETAAEQIEGLQGQIQFCIVTACFLVFHILYGDEFRTGFMINSIGRGYSRAKIVISKLVSSAVILFLVTLTAYLAALILNMDEELAVTARENSFLFLYMLYTFLKGIGYMAVGALFLFSSGSLAAGVVALVICSIFLDGILSMIQSELFIPVYDICYDGLLDKSYAVFQAGAFGWQIIPAFIVYICGLVFITVLIFNKKELEL